MLATTGTAAANSARALFDAALELLSRREHSRFEIKQKLAGRFPEADFDALFERLHQLNYQSDRRFAEVFTRSKAQRGYGPLRIRRELQQRGIDSDLIGDALEGAQVDWFALAAEQLQRRFHSPVSRALPREQQWKERARRQRFLANRGFSAEAIQWCLDAEGTYLADLDNSTR